MTNAIYYTIASDHFARLSMHRYTASPLCVHLRFPCKILVNFEQAVPKHNIKTFKNSSEIRLEPIPDSPPKRRLRALEVLGRILRVHVDSAATVEIDFPASLELVVSPDESAYNVDEAK